jgi:anaerobic selenocysteine-containing dehydrogenase
LERRGWDLRKGFKTLVLDEYSQRVSSLTGIPEDTIVQIAQEFLSNRPFDAISGRGVIRTNGTYVRWPSTV